MNKIKRIIFKFRLNKSNSLKNKKGAELVESILMVGVAIALIVVVFYPQITALMTTGFTAMQTLFTNAVAKLG